VGSESTIRSSPSTRVGRPFFTPELTAELVDRLRKAAERATEPCPMPYVYQPEISPISGPLARKRGTMAFHRLASRKGARRLAALGAAAALTTALLPGRRHPLRS